MKSPSPLMPGKGEENIQDKRRRKKRLFRKDKLKKNKSKIKFNYNVTYSDQSEYETDQTDLYTEDLKDPTSQRNPSPPDNLSHPQPKKWSTLSQINVLPEPLIKDIENPETSSPIVEQGSVDPLQSAPSDHLNNTFTNKDNSWSRKSSFETASKSKLNHSSSDDSMVKHSRIPSIDLFPDEDHRKNSFTTMNSLSTSSLLLEVFHGAATPITREMGVQTSVISHPVYTNTPPFMDPIQNNLTEIPTTKHSEQISIIPQSPPATPNQVTLNIIPEIVSCKIPLALFPINTFPPNTDSQQHFPSWQQDPSLLGLHQDPSLLRWQHSPLQSYESPTFHNEEDLSNLSYLPTKLTDADSDEEDQIEVKKRNLQTLQNTHYNSFSTLPDIDARQKYGIRGISKQKMKLIKPKNSNVKHRFAKHNTGDSNLDSSYCHGHVYDV